jgi:malate dehydrogenase (oxaloacetate-decarboxylating)
MDYFKKSLEEHKKNKGKLKIISKIPVTNKEELSIAYTPGVAEPCKEIAKDKNKVYDYVSSKNMVAVLTDGSAVLGLGNIGPEASLPVMEGKAVLFNEFAGVQAFPIALNTQDVEEIIKTVKYLEPTFGGINLEDISAPRCFEIEERLKNELNIPVFHDDQHGTAIVVLAGLINSLKITNKKKENIKVVINGSGAAGIAIAKLLSSYGVNEIIICDSKGIISKDRTDLNDFKKSLLNFTNKRNLSGTIYDAIKNSDVFIGVSKGNLLKSEDIKTMNKDPIIFAMANPIPEIMPDEAKKGGAKIIATGRSDFPNQLNNVLVFPGIFKGALEAKCQITEEMKIETAKELANIVENPTSEKIIPEPFEKEIAQRIANVVIKLSKK